ncbi:hypothetical protein T10_10699 [Trichinella papuae]|uniref:Uncharacterized protein n=1 Tax=Trichinella papuae TaxID=268474 RepID=A0A0V1LY91_9BILA|nr:hypothetical protein T10_10699 [Trichinella papuae]
MAELLPYNCQESMADYHYTSKKVEPEPLSKQATLAPYNISSWFN